jgi:signal transduction histidine kinase
VNRRLLLTYLTITAVALVALVVPLGVTFARRERDRLYFDIERDAVAVGSVSEDALEAGVRPRVGEILADYRQRSDGRVLVLDEQGISVADSEEPDAAPRDYSTRPEIAAALEGRRAIGTRRSATLGEGLVFVAVPVASGGEVHGAVRITFPTASLDARVRREWLQLAVLSAGVLGVVGVVGVVLARGVTRPVRELEATARRVAAGDLAARAPATSGPAELRRLAATFNTTAARLEELVGAQERFVADAAHQLRSPLTALRLRLENLVHQIPSPEVVKVEAAVAEVDRLSRIVDGLLLLARNEADHPRAEVVELTAAVVDRVDAWSDVAAERDVALRADVAGPVWALTPEGAVGQILDNLLANALDASPAGGVVVVSVSSPVQGPELRVTDQGPGMAAEDRRRAFDRFWRGDSSRPGSGLGLPIVRHLAQAAGGEASLVPGPADHGTAAVVRLLAAEAPRRTTRARASADR